MPGVASTGAPGLDANWDCHEWCDPRHRLDNRCGAGRDRVAVGRLYSANHFAGGSRRAGFLAFCLGGAVRGCFGGCDLGVCGACPSPRARLSVARWVACPNPWLPWAPRLPHSNDSSARARRGRTKDRAASPRARHHCRRKSSMAGPSSGMRTWYARRQVASTGSLALTAFNVAVARGPTPIGGYLWAVAYGSIRYDGTGSPYHGCKILPPGADVPPVACDRPSHWSVCCDGGLLVWRAGPAHLS